MQKKDLFIGLLIGIVSAIIGTLLFLLLFTEFSSLNDLKIIRQEGILGKVMTLGAILNILVFFFLLQKRKEIMARGVVLATLILAFITLFL
jgi:hypothetical protein